MIKRSAVVNQIGKYVVWLALAPNSYSTQVRFDPFKLVFLKWAERGLFLIYFRLFKETLQQIYVKNVHPAYGARTRTHNRQLKNLLPLPLDQGTHPYKQTSYVLTTSSNSKTSLLLKTLINCLASKCTQSEIASANKTQSEIASSNRPQ